MTTKTQPSAADVRKGLKSERADLTVKILPNIALANKGDFAVLKFGSTRRVTNLVPQKDGTVKDESFNVHDVTFVSGSIETMTIGKDKAVEDLKEGTQVSLKGNARLDRGFAMLAPGQSALIEYLGKVDVGNGRSANDYAFDIIK